MRVIVAPDSFKGTATAAEIAAAIADGWRSVRPDDDVVLRPMADGGEGTLDAFEQAFPSAKRMPIVLPGPDNRPNHTSWLQLPDGRAVVELAATSGITLMDRLQPDAAHTIGFGRAIAAALDSGATGLIVGIGGSASTDGGLSLLTELGLNVRFDDHAAPRAGGAALDHIVSVDTTSLRPLPSHGVTVLGDVVAPLLGPCGAATVYGPQKGVTAARIAAHEARLSRWAALFPTVDPATPGAGAAGGAGFGLLAWGAEITPGAFAIAAALGLRSAITDADIVITGEGRYDGQSESGKVPSAVRTIASDHTCFLVAGEIAAPPTGFANAVSLVKLAESHTGDRLDAMRDALAWAQVAGHALASSV
ncbi:MAG TPA: glycerate kinase [Leifsonia sp.]|nr:glycerate kinase [Leifsonia sp.]